MKNLFYLLLVSSLFFFCSKKETIDAPVSNLSSSLERSSHSLHPDFNFIAKKSGVWSDITIWQYDSAGVFKNALDIPNRTNDVYIGQGISVTLDSSQECRTINLNTYADVIRIDTKSDTLYVYNKLRIYEGNYPGGTSKVYTSGLINWISGNISFKGTASRTIIENGEYNANNTNSGWTAYIEFSSGATALINDRVRIENVIVRSGDLHHVDQLRLGTNYPNNTSDTIVNGKIIVKSGASLTGGILIYKNLNYKCDSIFFETGSYLNLTRNYDLYGRTTVLNCTQNLNGYTLTVH